MIWLINVPDIIRKPQTDGRTHGRTYECSTFLCPFQTSSAWTKRQLIDHSLFEYAGRTIWGSKRTFKMMQLWFLQPLQWHHNILLTKKHSRHNRSSDKNNSIYFFSEINWYHSVYINQWANLLLIVFVAASIYFSLWKDCFTLHWVSCHC